ncbi:MAG TPA: hypothetical protein VHB21_10720 [Minicystis sp.]|nr:hypothetical protein [Minicystis sp.]
MLSRPTAVAIAVATLAPWLAPARAAAEEPPGPPAEEIDPDAGLPKPPAPDWRSGHVFLTGRAAFLGPTGNAALVGPEDARQPIAVTDLATAGYAFGGVLGLGVSRHGVLEATVDYGLLAAPVGCSACYGRNLTLALGFSYHLAQATALDPWVSYGVGFRFQTYRVQNLVSGTVSTDAYRGIDVARLALGADFFPVRFAGLGPYLEGDIGTNIKFPHADYGGSAYAMFQFGVRLTLDPIRTGARAPARAASIGSVGF